MERRVIPGYEVGSPIGFGAGGTALAVRDAEGTSFAAVVVPKAGHRERFEELRALRHPHLPPIRALVEMNEHDVAVIMDLVVGPSLATLVNARTWLEPAEIATVWHGIADALAAMHHRGLVHGDVSPANVVIGPGGRPVLIDIVGHGGAERGHTGYIPPELDHGPATAASDVWSLARTLAWASGENAGVTDHLRGALAEDPTERPTAREFATWAHLLGEALPLEVPDAAALAGAQIRSAAAPTVLTPRPPERWPWQVLAAAVAGGLSLLMFAGHALGSAAEPPERSHRATYPIRGRCTTSWWASSVSGTRRWRRGTRWRWRPSTNRDPGSRRSIRRSPTRSPATASSCWNTARTCCRWRRSAPADVPSSRGWRHASGPTSA